MIENIKNDLNSKLGKSVEVIINEGRSKNLVTRAVIEKLYPHVFIIKVDNQNLSYSYSDIITKKIIIK